MARVKQPIRTIRHVIPTNNMMGVITNNTRNKPTTTRTKRIAKKSPSLIINKESFKNMAKVFTRNLLDYSPLLKSNNALPSTVKFQLNSSTEPDKKYNISFTNSPMGLILACNCGDQWNVSPQRNNCKHIGCTIANIIKTYLENSKVDISSSNIDELMDQFSKQMLND